MKRLPGFSHLVCNTDQHCYRRTLNNPSQTFTEATAKLVMQLPVLSSLNTPLILTITSGEQSDDWCTFEHIRAPNKRSCTDATYQTSQ